MDWMYNKNPDKVDPEEYLLGRAIDKNYFKQPSPENYMRSVRSDNSVSHSHTDLNRKTLEDPLTALRQKEIEKKKLLLQRTHLKFPDGVPINVISESQAEQPKSLEQLIIESLQKLKCDIDMEKFYKMIKDKKKNKKNRDNSSDSDTKSSRSKKKKKRSSSVSSNSDSSDFETDKKRNYKKSTKPNLKKNARRNSSNDCDSEVSVEARTRNSGSKRSETRRRKQSHPRQLNPDRKHKVDESKSADKRRNVDEYKEASKKKKHRSRSSSSIDSDLSAAKLKYSEQVKGNPNRGRSPNRSHDRKQPHNDHERLEQFQSKKRRAGSNDSNLDYRKRESKYAPSYRKNKPNDSPDCDFKPDYSNADEQYKKNYDKKLYRTNLKSRTPELRYKSSTQHYHHRNRDRSRS